MPFSAYHMTPGGELRRKLTQEQVHAAFVAREGLLWVDVNDTGPDDGVFLDQTFHFHPLAIEGCLETRVYPAKVDDYGDYFFLILHAINFTIESDLVEVTELDLFVGEHFVVSNHNYPLKSVDQFLHQVGDGNGRVMRRGAEFLAHALIDSLVENIVPPLNQLGDRADDIEEEIFESTDQSILETLLELKRSSLRLRRLTTPQVEVLKRLTHKEFDNISPEAEVFYQDVHDRMTRIMGTIENLQDRIETILTIYLSAVAIRQNESMRTLSRMSTIFLPLTLLASIYGMNFDYMPELYVRWGYFAVLGGMLALALVIVSWFWGRTWFNVIRGWVRKLSPRST
ncbi:MAG: magnesium/cobalt transporter CorA [Dehalococcoidia bacterium]|nr:magnesium/cobalt transporter CorA [Dehalococcoidia bacterium]MSQ17482.1 magnesium/cobalt transporter CorA [Dehalococcoidia bacterium]